MDRRFVVFIVISIGIIAFSNYFTMKNVKKSANSEKNIEKVLVDEEKNENNSNIKNAEKSLKVEEKKIENVKKEEISTKYLKIEALSTGGKLAKIEVKRENKDEISEIITPSLNGNHFIVNANANGTPLQLDQINWDILAENNTLLFKTVPADGLKVEKLLRIDQDAYTGTIELNFYNEGEYEINIDNVHLMWGPEKTVGKGRYNVRQIVSFNKGKVTRFKPKKKDEITPVDISTGWIGMSDQYFCAMFYGDAGIFKNALVERKQDQTLMVDVVLPEKKIAPKSMQTYTIKVYLGPQNYQDMKALGYNINKIVNFGMFTFLSVPMYYLLKLFYKLTTNYGLAIILLTILIRIILWWPTQKSYSSMKKMQTSMNQMQPRLKTLKEVYRDNPAKLNEETMKLYKEYQINPMGGCLPMLLQMPVFFALFSTLSSAVELKGSEFFWVWKDLSAKDPVYILPILMGLSMFIQQKISSPPAATPEAAAQQKMMLYMMPAMLTFFSFIWPSGLLLYWVVSNVLSIGQQVFINRKA